jgi:hypothetical protein
MLMVLLVVFLILSVVMSIWALVIIFKRSIVGGLLTLFLGLPMLYYLIVGWGKEEGDIRKPFFLSIIFYVIAIGAGFKYVSSTADEFKQQFEVPAPTARRAPLFPEPAPTRAAESVRVRDTPAPRPAAAPQFPAQRVETVRTAREEPRRQKPAQSDCIYKPVMTDEDMAKCR